MIHNHNSINRVSFTYENCLYDNKHKSKEVKLSCNIKIALIIKKELINLMAKRLFLLINKINSPKPPVLLYKYQILQNSID